MRVCIVTSQFEKLGVEYISAMLKLAGHDVALAYDPRLFDDAFNVKPVLGRLMSYERQLVDDAVSTKADIFAISALSPDWNWARRISTALKERTGNPIILGGLHASAATSYVVKHAAIDYVVTGEAEEAVVDLVGALDQGRDPVAMANVSLMRDGRPIYNPNRFLLMDLDLLPFPDKKLYYDVSDHFKYGYNIMAARGCPKACSYCFNSWYRLQFPNKESWVRTRSIDNLLAELEFAKLHYQPSHFRFLDDDFLFNRSWFLEFARKYRHSIGTPYRIFVDADSCDEETVQALNESGCFEAEMGVQTIKHDLRTKVFKRGQIEGQVQAAIEAFAKTKITLVADNIFGYPDQTPEDIKELISFYQDFRPDRVQNLWLRYWPGATIIKTAQEQGYMTAAEAQEIYENPTERGCVIGDEKKRGWELRAATFLYMTFYLPRRFVRFWLEKNRFVRFPLLPVFTIYSALNFFSAEFSMYGQRFIHRYSKYGLYRVLRPVRRLIDRLFNGGRSPLLGPFNHAPEPLNSGETLFTRQPAPRPVTEALDACATDGPLQIEPRRAGVAGQVAS